MNNDKDSDFIEGSALRYFTPAELNALYQAIVHALTTPYLSFSVERNLRSARQKIIQRMLKKLNK